MRLLAIEPHPLRHTIKSAALVLLIIALILPPAHSSAANPASAPPPPGDYRPGVLLVKLKPLVDTKSAASVLAAAGLVTLEEIPALGLQVVAVPPGQELDVATQLGQNPLIEYAEPDYIAHGLATPNDEYFIEQWNLTRIMAEQAWDITTGSEDITIAIVDTGVDLTHPDLSDKIVPGWDFVNDDDEPQDDHGHGTRVAGVAAATSNNSIGITGVSWGAKIMPLKALNEDNWGFYSHIAQAITYAADHGAKIINLSLGKHMPSSTLEEAVEYAYSQGCLLVAAAGDEAADSPPHPLLYPAAYDQVLAVAGSDYNDRRVNTSGYGSHIDVAAPSLEIPATNWPTSPYPYTVENGTSLAAPQVAGIAALIWSVQPSYTVTNVMNLIAWTSEDITASPASAGWDEYTGWGRINARRALAGIIGYVKDNEGRAVSGATVAANGPVTSSTTSQADGFFRHASALPGTYSVTASSAGFGSLPAMHGVQMITGTDTITLTFVLPPSINVVQNWDFENGADFANWTIGGAITPVITSTAHTGFKAALLGQNPPSGGGDSLITQTIYITPTLHRPHLSFAYTLATTDTVANDRFEVWVSNGTLTTTVLSTCTAVDWTYVSHDMSAYTGTVTLNFRVTQNSSAGPTTVRLDEVSVGSMYRVYLPLTIKNY
ncbi:MAG: S8 family serine peptidase [Anaerolineae bacterium]|nr:S8 family serine peptidase [Anaerolineae bacterium]